MLLSKESHTDAKIGAAYCGSRNSATCQIIWSQRRIFLANRLEGKNIWTTSSCLPWWRDRLLGARIGSGFPLEFLFEGAKAMPWAPTAVPGPGWGAVGRGGRMSDDGEGAGSASRGSCTDSPPKFSV